MPIDPREIAGLVEIESELAMEGVPYRNADPARQMNVRGEDLKQVVMRRDGHDPIERVLGLFGGFFVSRQRDDLFGLCRGKRSVAGHDTGRHRIRNAAAGGTATRVRIFGGTAPGPAPPVKDGVATGANRRLVRFFLRLVGIADGVVLSPSGTASAGIK